MSGQVKGLLITAVVVYVGVILYHKGMLPMAGGPKKIAAGDEAKLGE